MRGNMDRPQELMRTFIPPPRSSSVMPLNLAGPVSIVAYIVAISCDPVRQNGMTRFFEKSHSFWHSITMKRDKEARLIVQRTRGPKSPVCASVLRAPCTMLVFSALLLIPCAVFAQPETKTVVILKQRGSAHDIFTKDVRAAFTTEVVTEKQDQQKGLSGRDSLPDDAGMLFVLGVDNSRFFWMKDMKFPIDIIVFDRGMKVIEILRDLQPCTQCVIYSVSESAAYALEINAGVTKKFGIEIGDTFVFGKE